MLVSVADPGFVKTEGRESKFRDAAPGLKKSLSGGGGGGTWSDRVIYNELNVIHLKRPTKRLELLYNTPSMEILPEAIWPKLV